MTDRVESDAAELTPALQAPQEPQAPLAPDARAAARSQLAISSPLVAGLIVGIPSAILYWRTLMPDVYFWDTGEFQAIGPVLGIAHPTGYPAYTMLAWVASVVLQPFGNEAFRANLLSAILVAVAVGLVAGIVTRLTGRLVVGVATGFALAITTRAWSIGLSADPHAFHLMLAALLLALLVTWQNRVRDGAPADRWLVAAAITFGVSLANHGLTYLLAPGIGVFVLMVQPGILRKPKLIVACAGALALTTAALYAYLPIRSAMNPPMDYANPQTLEGFRYLVFAEQFRGTFQQMPDLITGLRTIATETFTQLGLFAVLAILGVVVTAARRAALMVLVVLWFGVNWFFALGYLNADIGRYYLVPLMCAAVLGGLGAAALIDWISGALAGNRWRAAPAAIGVVAAVILIVPLLPAVGARYRTLDSSDEVIARSWLTGVTSELEENAVVVSWWSYSTTLWYGQFVEHLRPDVMVIDDSTIVQQNLGSVTQVINSYLGQRPVYLIRTSYDLPRFEALYVLTPVPGITGGPVYEVQGMKA